TVYQFRPNNSLDPAGVRRSNLKASWPSWNPLAFLAVRRMAQSFLAVWSGTRRHEQRQPNENAKNGCRKKRERSSHEQVAGMSSLCHAKVTTLLLLHLHLRIKIPLKRTLARL